jgi:hypothetical protein
VITDIAAGIGVGKLTVDKTIKGKLKGQLRTEGGRPILYFVR